MCANETKEQKGNYVRIAPDGLTEGVIEMTSTLSAVVHRAATGETEDLGVISRMKVSTAFVQVLCRAMDGNEHTTEYGYFRNYMYHEWGTSAATEGNTQTKCVAHASNQAEYASGLLVSGTQVGGSTSYSSVATLTASSNYSISEHCLHPTAGCGTAPYEGVDSYGLDRSTFTGIPLSTGDSITFTYTLNVPAES